MQAGDDMTRGSHTVADATGEEVGCHTAIDVRVLKEAQDAAAEAGNCQGFVLDARWGFRGTLQEGQEY